jgi:hypothetical protein
VRRVAAPVRSCRTLDLYGAQSITGPEVAMATKTTVTLEDDLDGGPADETLRFAIGGAKYEIDLSAKNARAFRRQLGPFIDHARRAGRGQRRRPAGTRGRPTAQRRDPRVGKGPGHPGQHPRAHSRQHHAAVRSLGQRI